MKTNFKFEEEVIDPILNYIRDNQEYLTRKENLPQLAKLGYMYNTLWYTGRVCWGFDGILWGEEYPRFEVYDEEYPEDGSFNYSACENNPKYKIEECNPINEEIEDWIYDAWAMHVSNNNNDDWEKFKKIVLEGEELTELNKLSLVENKTYDQWEEILLHPDYKYALIFPDKKSVADHLLCVLGGGYDYKDGYIFEEAGGADQNLASYGDWKNCNFREDLKELVDRIMKIPEVEKTVTSSYNFIDGLEKERQKKEDLVFAEVLDMSYEDYLEHKAKRKTRDYSDLFPEIKEEEKTYYPISENYANISKLDENAHISYIKKAFEICEDILANHKNEENGNLEFANANVDKFRELLIKKQKDEYK
jgi:hypothetical protein